MVSYLLKNKANPNIQDNKGQSPLHYAVSHLNYNTIEKLIGFDADVNLLDSERHSPISIAMTKKNWLVAMKLI